MGSVSNNDPGLPRPNPTQAFWQLPPHPDVSAIQSPTLRTETDIVVIGSGITGCSVSKALLEDESFGPIHVTVLEARTLTSGATGRNGGHLVSAAGHKFSDWVEHHGVEAARDMARFSLMNVDRVQEILSKMDADIQEKSEIRTVQKLCAVTDDKLWEHHVNSIKMMAKEVPEHKNHNRLAGAKELNEEWGLIDVVGGYIQQAGALWPYRLCTEVFTRLLKAHPDRLAIETHTPVTSVFEDPDAADNKAVTHRYIVTTPRGLIKAKRVVYCTNGFTAHLLPSLRGKIYPFRGHMTTQAVPAHFPSQGGERSWSLMQPTRLDPQTGSFHFGLYYLQQNAKTKDMFVGTEYQTIEECLCSDDTFVSEASRKDLPALLPRMFSAVSGDGLEKPTLRAIWSGVMGMTPDGLPLVGKLPGNATGREPGEEWIAAGFQGYGMDKCWLTGEALVGMMAGRDVSSWFPSPYVITEERLAKKMGFEHVWHEYASMVQEKQRL
ncbi:FAD dependent oxidoreductase [Cryphonectria parasitica EP155]|uniref:FAD dependent oxidoreductase n=1 Tax=Cryphonectria parasitica (strain ATCC 38755 / EP155) TaxID=660469 RepID=A0A9P4Y287_CRYP1|nr:FAD dependent oxidoreductase [Cryphonectria parasitica EP155]KAF3765012.1 FAD dependent oxidoreductase [Cryphonectria parasitica EP155]